jgi:hypothetical protein
VPSVGGAARAPPVLVAPALNQFSAIESAISSPAAVAALMTHPPSFVAAFIARVAAGVRPVRRGGASLTSALASLAALEALLTLEAEARALVTRIRRDAARMGVGAAAVAEALASTKLFPQPSGCRIAPAGALALVAAFDALAEARMDGAGGGGAGGGGAGGGGGGLEVAASLGLSSLATSVTAAATAASLSAASPASSALASGPWGVDFTTSLLLASAADATSLAWRAAPVLLLLAAARPAILFGVLEACTRAVAPGPAANLVADATEELVEDLRAHMMAVDDESAWPDLPPPGAAEPALAGTGLAYPPTSPGIKEGVSMAFVRWAAAVAG